MCLSFSHIITRILLSGYKLQLMRVYAAFILAFLWLECSAGKSSMSETFSVKNMSKGPIAVIAAGLAKFITGIG